MATNTVVPRLCVPSIVEAVAFYAQAFGAEETIRLLEPGGKIAFSEISINGLEVELSEEEPRNHNFSPRMLGGSTVIIKFYVDDVDTVFNQALAAGAKTLFAVDSHFFGERSGRLVDPFGHMWSISTLLEEMTPEELQRRFDAFLQQQ